MAVTSDEHDVVLDPVMQSSTVTMWQYCRCFQRERGRVDADLWGLQQQVPGLQLHLLGGAAPPSKPRLPRDESTS